MTEDKSMMKLSEVIGKGYNEFWNTKKFYRLVKGSKGSKKSYTAALWYIYHMMKYPKSNLIVIRKTFSSIQNTVYATIEWAIDRLGVNNVWKKSLSPLKMTYKPTGQKIIFTGFDDALKIASVSAGDTGYFCWVWFEEFTDITNEEEFDKLMMSIRGTIPPETGLWKQITGTFNPWSENHWIKKRFFDNPAPNVFTLTTTYKCNEHLDEVDIERYERMYVENPRMARIICDGDWGVAHGLIYENWKELDFNIHDVMNNHPNLKFTYGLDFGFAISFNAFVAVAVDVLTRELWIFDEMYDHGLPNIEIAKRINRMGYGKEQIWADAAEPKSIFELQTGLIEEVEHNDGTKDFINWQLPNIRPALKGPDSVKNGIQNLQSYRMYVHPNCRNTLIELGNYCWDKDKDENFIDKPIKEFDHCLIGSTLIMTDKGEIPIKDIKVGDMVLTRKGYHKVIFSGKTSDDALVWNLDINGHRLGLTPDHRIWNDTEQQFVQVQDCKITDRALLIDGTTAEIGDRTITFEAVYDLTVECEHEFFANGILVHNCLDALRYSMAKLFVRARGHVAEARGMDSIGSPTTPININGVAATATVMGPNESVPGGHKRVRRVFSTH